MESYTFEHVYKGMDRLRVAGTQQQREMTETAISRTVTFKAFENLIRLGLVLNEGNKRFGPPPLLFFVATRRMKD